MTIAALSLGHQFYVYNPSEVFKYATLGLLFVNISGRYADAFCCAAGVYGRYSVEMGYGLYVHAFCWRAAIGITIATAVYFFIFRKNFAALKEKPILLRQKRRQARKSLSRSG